MMYFRWLLFAPISFAFNLFCILTSPLWALWAAIFKLDKLPGWFAVVHTHDDDIYGPRTPTSFGDRFKDAIWWISRNPGYSFDAWVLGFKGEGVVFEKDDRSVKFDTGENAVRHTIMLAANGKRYFSYRRDVKLGGGRFIKMWIGWQNRTQAGYHIIKVDFNPFKKVKK